jgi:prepilin-type N-terminal cleavage/methylation domain-containing protein
MSPRATRRLAFTLVEVMLAIAIFSIVIAAIYGTWRAIMGATRAGQIAAAEVQRKRIALRCIEQSLTYTEMFAANASYYGFEAENGSDAMLSFVSRLPKDFPRSGRFGDLAVRRVMFALEPGEDRGQNLVLRQAPLLSEFDLDEQEYPLVLLRNVRRMEMEFWDLQKRDWTDEWRQTNQVPKLIRIAITMEGQQNSYDRGEEYFQVIAPAAAAVQAAWQGRAPGQPPGQPPGLAPGQPPLQPPGGPRTPPIRR